MSNFILRAERGGPAIEGIHFFSFPGGERHVRLPALEAFGAEARWELTAHLDDAQGVVDLLLLSDALRRHIPQGRALHLVLPYVPYARQDRVAVAGEPFSAAVFCGLVNSLRFDSVTVMDPHSAVVVDLLERVVVVPAADLVGPALVRAGRQDLLAQAVLVAPDAGAAPRVQAVAQALSVYRQEQGDQAAQGARGSEVQVVQALKKRDPLTGRLSAPELAQGIPTDRPLLVVDDICDGGGTFIQLAQVLREHTQAPLYLYVTHGIFSKGLAPLLECFDAVFCAHPFAAVADEILKAGA